MKLKNTAILGWGQTRPKVRQDEIAETRRHVISGDWSAINAGICSLADLGLRHNGSGLVWLRSGVSVHQADYDAGVMGKDKTVGSVNGLPLAMVRQWTEYQTKRSFAVSIPAELRRKYYPDDAAFGKAMRDAGYVPARTTKFTGKQQTFWLYRKTGNDKGVCKKEIIKINKITPVFQAIVKPHPWFKRVALDGKWLYVYADHIRFLTKKRHRVDGARVQSYTVGELKVEVLA